MWNLLKSRIPGPGGVLALGLLIAACAGEGSYSLQVVFPDQDAYDRTSQLAVWALEPGGRECTHLAEGATDPETMTVHARLMVDWPVDTTFSLTRVPAGRILFFAEGRTTSGAVILRACVDAEVRGGETVEVVLLLDWFCRPDPAGEIAANGEDDDCDGLTDECTSDADCRDGNGCTLDVCLQDECHFPISDDGVLCNDENLCTSDDRCQAGVCTGTPRDCSAYDRVCVEGACDPYTGTCWPRPAGDGSACDDGLYCTDPDSCQEGICTGADLSCDDGDDCTRDSCDEGGKRCDHVLQARPGDEGPPGDLTCTNSVDDDCDGLIDTEDPNCNACSTDTECDDSNPCTSDRCAGGSCENLPLADGTDCDDDLYCTVGDICAAGACLGSGRDCSAVSVPCADGVCLETQQTCSPQVRPDGSACDDGQYCTVGDQCATGACDPGVARDCGDADLCTQDSCDEAAGTCEHVLMPRPGDEGPPGTCANGVDDDCDGATDDYDPDCWTVSESICSEDGWCWENPIPQGNIIQAIWGPSANNAWAVGHAGTMLHWDGTNWSEVPLGVDAHLIDIWGLATDDVWAVGAAGTILHFDGTSWELQDGDVSTATLLNIWGSSRNDVWVTGDDGTLLHWNGLAWDSEESGTMLDLIGIWGSARDDVWIVGEGATLLHFDGNVWSPATSPLSYEDIMAVWGSGPDDVWAAAWDPESTGTLVIHYDGGDWSELDSGTHTCALLDIWGTGPEDVWVVGADRDDKGCILHDDGLELISTYPSPDHYVYHLGVWGTAPDDVWTVGSGGTLLHWDGADWSSVSQGTTFWMYGLWGEDPDDFWAAGAEGDSALSARGVVGHWDGESWTLDRDSVPAWLFGIWGFSSDDIWAVGIEGDVTDAGQAAIAHWDGAGWTPFETGLDAGSSLFDIWGATPNDIWAVGMRQPDGGSEDAVSVLQHWGGTSWATVWSSTDVILSSVWGVAEDAVWFVGFDYLSGSPLVLRWDGIDLFTMDTGGRAANLYLVWASAPDDLWLGGVDYDTEATVITRWDGSDWTDSYVELFDESRTFPLLYDLWGTGPDDIYAVGSPGVVLHYDGTGWTQMQSGTTNTLSAVRGANPSEIWTAGFHGTLLRRQGS